MDNKENPSGNEEIVEVVVPTTQEAAVVEDPFAKGRERMDAIASTIASTKEKVVANATRIGSKISRFFSRAGKIAKTVGAAVFSADDLAKKGAEWTGEKVDQFAEAGIQKIADAEQWVSDKRAHAEGWMSETAEQAGVYVGGKYAQGKEFVGEVMDAGAEKYHQFEDLCGRGAQNVEEFVEASAQWAENKVDRAKEITIEGIEIAKDVAFAVQTKTTEAFAHAKEGVKNQYNNAVEFGERALVKVKVGWAKGKETFRGALNSWRLARLNARIERDIQTRERLLKIEGKVNLLSEVNQLEVAA